MVYYRFDDEAFVSMRAFVSIDPSFPLETFDLMVNFCFVGFTLIQYWSCYFLLKASKIPTTLYTLGFGDLRIPTKTVASLPVC